MKLLDSVSSILLIYCLYSAVALENGSGKEYGDVIITTGLGKVRGTYLTSRSGRIFYAFRGIRYAKSPVDDLRFKAPEPIEQWNGIFDATTDGPMCPQPTTNLSEVSEDCLRINIYSHELPTETKENVRRPVIVYLHPGGFYSVSGQSYNFAAPHSIMDRNIVFVTINYRLGSLGFMSTGTRESPGNAGLKDQVMALKWIKLHIARFGGDPNSVTLMGYSAGALSITLHMISPMSRGLFHKAIVMSASATAQWEIPAHQIELAQKQARLLKCPETPVKDMVDCLKTKDAVDFGTSLEDMFEFGQGLPVLLWKPVIEPDFGQERFLVEDPISTYQRGRFMKIPVIAGITKDEFVYPAINILNNETLRQALDTNFNELAPICFQYERGTERSDNISGALREFYIGGGTLHQNRSLEGLAQLFADGVIGFGVHRFVHLVARFTRIYYYRFSYQGRFSHTYYPKDKPYGVVHHDDLIYFFRKFNDTDPEVITIERLTRMWAAFAYKGDPNKPNDEYLRGIRWRPFGLRREQYLDIGDDLVMKEGLYSDRFDLWRELFPLDWPFRRNREESNDYPTNDDES